MSISYPISLPSAPVPKTSRFTMSSAVAVSESPFTFEQQAQVHQGQRWRVQLTFPPMPRSNAEQIVGTLAKLNGREGTILIGDYDGRTPRGIATGTPLVNGGAQTGNSLATKGWTAGKTGILLRGDYLQLGSGATARLYKVLDDANSDGSGNATFTIWPNLRSSPSDGAAIVVSNTVSVFRLNSSEVPWDANEVSVYGLTFAADEAL